jgi:hypothetical protein
MRTNRPDRGTSGPDIGVPESDDSGADDSPKNRSWRGTDIAASRGMIEASQNLKVVLRRIRRSPGTSLLVVATLGLVLGANTRTFSFVNEIILNPLPAITNKTGLVNVHRCGPAWRASRVSPSVALRAN